MSRSSCPKPGHEITGIVDGAAAKAGIRLNIRHEIDAITIIKQVILTERIVTIMLRSAGWPETSSGQLSATAIRNPVMRRPLVLATMGGQLSPLGNVLAKATRQQFRKQLVEDFRSEPS